MMDRCISFITREIFSRLSFKSLILPSECLEFVFLFFCLSSGVMDSERDSTRKTRWNSMINQEDSSSSSGECSPVNFLRKSKKTRNEATILLRFDGEVNILVTPLLVEALQRCV